MMNLKFPFFLFFVGIHLVSIDSYASEESQTVVLNVYGGKSCTASIETLASSFENVTSASFNAALHTLTLVVLPAFDANDLYFLLASKGFDAGNVRAKDELYNQLSAECRYERKQEEVVRD
jgi:predicted acyltransferase